MILPSDAAQLMDQEFSRLVSDASYDLTPTLRTDLFGRLGPSRVGNVRVSYSRVQLHQIPVLTPADRVRARIGILTAQKVSALWTQACIETNRLNGLEEDDEDTPAADLDYFRRLQAVSLEGFPVENVPRRFIPQHILAMAELVMQSRVKNPPKLLAQAGEWWQVYTSPVRCQREFAIKWAAQEALYLSLLWEQYPTHENYDYDDNAHDLNKYAYNQTQGPAGFSLLAYAGVFDQDDRIVDPVKRQEFWLWWLGWAIPTAIELESD